MNKLERLNSLEREHNLCMADDDNDGDMQVPPEVFACAREFLEKTNLTLDLSMSISPNGDILFQFYRDAAMLTIRFKPDGIVYSFRGTSMQRVGNSLDEAIRFTDNDLSPEGKQEPFLL
jgi:hypothetical protein